MSSPMQEKFQAFEDEIRQRDPPPARITGRWVLLLATSSLLLAGFLLYKLPGSVPPPAWVELVRLVRAHAIFPLAAHLTLVGRSLAFFIAYILWLYVAFRVLQMFRRPDPHLLLSQSPAPYGRPAERNLDRAASDEQRSSTRREPVFRTWEMRSASATGKHLEDTSGDQMRPPGASQISVHLNNLVIQTSSLAKSRPALPAVLLIPGDSRLVAQGEAREGIGLAVASCCHYGRGKRVGALEDASLSAIGLSWWPEATPQVLPIGLFLVSDGGIVGEDRDRYSTSYLAVQLLEQTLLPLLLARWPPDEDAVGRGVANSIQQVNAALHQRASAAGVAESEMDTGFASALVLGTTAYIANVGNSRAYYYHPGDELIQITVDHARTVDGAEQAVPNCLDAAQMVMERHPHRSQGSVQQVEATLRTIKLAVGDILLLCSDGFWERVERPLLEQTLQWFASTPAVDPVRLCSVLQERALERGSEDHLSIIAVQVMRLPSEGEKGP